MRNSLAAKHFADQLRSLNGDGTNQNRLVHGMCLFDFLYDCVEFLFFRHVYGIVHIHTDDRAVGRDLDNVHAVDVTELLLLGEGSTGHAGFFLVFVKEVLERDGCQSLALSSYFNVLFCLDCLMQTIGITAARHDTAGELIDDQNLVVFDYVVLVAVHQIIGTQRQDHVVLDLQVLRIGEVLNMEEVLDFLHTVIGQGNEFVLLVDDEVSGLLDLLAHDRGHLGHLAACLAALHLVCQNICGLVQLGGFAALSGNNQRCSCLVDQDGVDLVDDTVSKLSLYELLFVDHHVVTQVIETKFVVGDVGDVACILLAALIVLHIVQNDTDGQTEESVDFAHPLSISVCQVIVDGNDVYTASGQCIQVSRKGGNEGFSFTGFHLGDTALMEDNTTDQLYAVVFHTEGTFCCLADGCECFRENGIQGFASVVAVFIFLCLGTQLFIGQRLHGRAESFDFVYDWIDSFQLALTVRTKKFFCEFHRMFAPAFSINCHINIWYYSTTSGTR